MADETIRPAGPGDMGVGREPGVGVGDRVGRTTQGGAMAVHTMSVTSRPPMFRRISWGSIIAGALVAISCQLVLTTLGLAIGMATVNPATEANPAEGLGLGAGVWWLVTGLISLFIGGLVAGRMAAFTRWIDAALHGLVVWALTAVASLYLLTTSVAGLIGGAAGGLRDAAVAAASNPHVTQQVGGQSGDNRSLVDRATGAMENIRREATEAMGGPGAGTGNPEVDRMLRDAMADGSLTAQERESAVTTLVDRAGMDRADAERAVQRFETSSGQAGGGRVLASPEPTEREVRQAGQEAADTLTNAATWSFFAMLLGALAAALGGLLGRPSNVVIAEERLAMVPG